MNLTLKLIIFFSILIIDSITGLVVFLYLNRQGKGEQAKVVVMALIIGIVTVGVVLFGVL